MLDKIIRLLNERDVEWELYWEKGRSGSFSIERESLERSQRKFYSGIGLRVGYRGRLGFSYITGLEHDRETLERFVNRTIKLARVSEVPFVGFPEDGRTSSVRGLYDRTIDEIPFEDAQAMAVDFAGSMREIKGDSMTLSGGLAFEVTTEGVVNSNGIFKEERHTGMSVSAYAVKRGVKTGTGSHHQTYRRIQPFEELEAAIKAAVNDAELNYRAVPLKPHSGEVLLEPEAFRSVLGIMLDNLYGDSVYFGRSRFSSPGESITSEVLTIVDDSTLKGGTGSYSFDGEGVSARRTVLVDRGVLSSFLFDHTYASFMGVESTGNALRDFKMVPRIGASNLMVEAGSDDLEDFDGVVIKRVFGEHTANSVSGDFSLTVDLGYVVDNGELRPFKDNMFVGNVFELLRSVGAVGNRLERVGSFISPRVVCEGNLV